MVEEKLVVEQNPREAQLQRVDTLINDLLKRFPEFNYQETKKETLQAAGKFRKINAITYTAGQNEEEHLRELLVDRGGSYVLALTPEQEVILELQVRPGLDQPYQVELVAGGLDENEEPVVNALKELSQEVGVNNSLGNVASLGVGPVMAGRTPQNTHFFLIEGVEIDPNKQQLEKGELIIPFTCLLGDVNRFVNRIMTRDDLREAGFGVDPKILSALSLAAEYFANNGDSATAKSIFNF